jgi:RNA-splicing ligase RtcB
MFIGASAYNNLEYLPIEHGGREYLLDMEIAQKYAELNREFILNDLLEYFKTKIVDSITSVHNYISFKDDIIRKGAISAHEGERVIIPLNMRDGIIIGTGKGSKKWNYSAPHGAGRVLSRKKAKQELSLDSFNEEMTGIWTSCVSKETLDESPMAYKDKQIIIDTIGESVKIDKIVKPVYNFKAVS